jgi:hypothetical protein
VLLPTIAYSQANSTASIVHVRFDFHENIPMPRNVRSQLEAQIENGMAQALNQAFTYWDFEPGKGDLPQLTISLESLSVDLWKIHLSIAISHHDQREWSDDLFEAGQLQALGGLPGREQWFGHIMQRFGVLLGKNKDKIKTFLSNNVSLITAKKKPAAVAMPVSEAVIPLQWGASRDLRFAEFRVMYWCPHEAREIPLHARGIGQKNPYTPQHREFDGFTIRFEWSSHLAHFSDLRFLALFINKETDAELSQVDDQ